MPCHPVYDDRPTPTSTAHTLHTEQKPASMDNLRGAAWRGRGHESHMTSSLVTTHWGRVPSVHRTYYPALAWLIQFRAYAMPSVPVPPIILLTDMVTRSRLLAAHGLTSCLSVRTQPLTATGAPSQTSTMPCHARGGGCVVQRQPPRPKRPRRSSWSAWSTKHRSATHDSTPEC